MLPLLLAAVLPDLVLCPLLMFAEVVDDGLDGDVLTTVLLGAAVAVLLVAEVLFTPPVAADLETPDDDATVLRDVLEVVAEPPLMLLLLVNTLSAPVMPLWPLYTLAYS